MPKLILLNGPPRSGKDECAKMLFSKQIGTRSVPFPHWFRMSQPIKDAIRVTWNMTEQEQAFYEKNKEAPQRAFNGKSYRQVQISFSEDWMKQQFGPRVFGELALTRLRKSIASVFVCSDCGFAEEVEPLFLMFEKKDTVILRLTRPGYSFKGDSRSYISIPGVTTLHIQNDGSLNMLLENVEAVTRMWLDDKAE
jgi:hypothetical protein